MHPIEIINNTPKWHDWVRIDLEKDKNILIHNQQISLPDPTGEKWAVYPINFISEFLQENPTEHFIILDGIPIYATTGSNNLIELKAEIGIWTRTLNKVNTTMVYHSIEDLSLRDAKDYITILTKYIDALTNTLIVFADSTLEEDWLKCFPPMGYKRLEVLFMLNKAETEYAYRIRNSKLSIVK